MNVDQDNIGGGYGPMFEPLPAYRRRGDPVVDKLGWTSEVVSLGEPPGLSSVSGFQPCEGSRKLHASGTARLRQANRRVRRSLLGRVAPLG